MGGICGKMTALSCLPKRSAIYWIGMASKLQIVCRALLRCIQQLQIGYRQRLRACLECMSTSVRLPRTRSVCNSLPGAFGGLAFGGSVLSVFGTADCSLRCGSASACLFRFS